jgi:ATP diphosphatase
VLDGMPPALPALTAALEIGRRVAKVNFDWPDTDGVHAKIHEELDEIHDAVARGDAAHIAEEVGDLLFTVASLARKLNVDPEGALRDANRKFSRRFRDVEARVSASGRNITTVSLDELEAHWQAVK